jgi:hypothetical protein
MCRNSRELVGRGIDDPVELGVPRLGVGLVIQLSSYTTYLDSSQLMQRALGALSHACVHG